MEPKKVVLIVSTGAQDLKFWASNELNGTIYVVSLPIGGDCREFHKRLNAPAAKQNFYRVVTFEEIKLTLKGCHIKPCIQTKLKKFMDWDEQNRKIKRDVCIPAKILELGGIAGELAFRPLRDKDDRYLLAPAKIAGTVEWLAKESSDRTVELAGALLFATEREEAPTLDLKNREPIATGHVLAQWLEQQFPDLKYSGQEGLDFQHFQIGWVNYLKNEVDFSGKGRDAPVKRSIVARIDDAVDELYQAFPHATAVLSDTGGMAEVKACLQASVRFRFRGEVAEIGDPETISHSWDLDMLKRESRLPSRRESLEARMHCEQRLRQGDFLGAWGAVAHMQGSDDDKDWIEPVRQVADFMRGAEISAPGEEVFADLRPIVVDATLADVFRAAFKVEAALQHIDHDDVRVGDAVLGTVNFYDVALRALINKAILHDPEFKKFVRFRGDPAVGEVEFCNPIPKKFHPDHAYFFREKNREKKKNNRYEVYVDGRGDTTWVGWLEGEEKLNTSYLSGYRDRLTVHTPKWQSIRTLRNSVAHRTLKHSDADEAINVATLYERKGKHLWNITETSDANNGSSQFGNRFLSVPLAINLFQLFEIEKPESYYYQMMHGLIDKIRGSMRQDHS